jgi:general secretion pathway protein E
MLGIKKIEGRTIYHPKGCPACNGTGYEGRIGLYELVVVNDRLRKLIHDDAGEQEMREEAFRNAPTLAEAGYEHVIEGRTSIEEVLRVVQETEGT